LTSKYLIVASLCLLTIAHSSNAARQRITLAPEPGVYSKADIQKEILFGREIAAIILADRKLSSDSELNRYLNLVGQSIVRHTNRPELEYSFAAVNSSEINAYAVPGGYIFITTAALGMMQNEAELAAVLAHEIAHVSDRHIVRALDIRADDESMTAIVSKVVGSTAESASVIFYQAVDHALALLFDKGLAVEEEFEADIQGLYLTAFAGYDPTAYPRFLERISAVVESRRSELGKTHPPFSERINRLEKIIETEGLSKLGNYKNEKRFGQYQSTGG
jgi:predicted Zn-dependent protease